MMAELLFIVQLRLVATWATDPNILFKFIIIMMKSF